jgi:hypothetical protein
MAQPSGQSVTISGMTITGGAGAPALAAPKGSLYLRNDGTTSATRLYSNTDGSTTWTPVTTTA